jgi:hypothetical protein
MVRRGASPVATSTRCGRRALAECGTRRTTTTVGGGVPGRGAQSRQLSAQRRWATARGRAELVPLTGEQSTAVEFTMVPASAGGMLGPRGPAPPAAGEDRPARPDRSPVPADTTVCPETSVCAATALDRALAAGVGAAPDQPQAHPGRLGDLGQFHQTRGRSDSVITELAGAGWDVERTGPEGLPAAADLPPPCGPRIPAGTSAAPSPWPTLPSADFPTFRAAARRHLGRAVFALVDGEYRAAAD